jgi:hypothetical protein
MWYGIFPLMMGLYWMFNRNSGSAKPILSLMLAMWLIKIAAGYYEMNGKRDAFKSPLPGAPSQITRAIQRGSGAVQVTDEVSGEVLFEHFATSGAARLKSLDRQPDGSWLATFALDSLDQSSTARGMRGWFEQETDTSPPGLKCFRSIFGNYRVEEKAMGKTLFSYRSGTRYKPITARKVAASKWEVAWQVLFSTQAE